MNSTLKRSSPLRRTSRLRQSRSTGKPTKAQASRFDRMREFGCVACAINFDKGMPTATFGQNNLEIHHLLSCGRRIGHDATVCLCHYHHQAKRLMFTEHGYKEQAAIFGPSLEREPRAFRELYGTDDQLLARQARMMGEGV